MSRPVALAGVIRGKTIELEVAPDMPDGQVVWIGIVPAKPSVSAEGLLRASAVGPMRGLNSTNFLSRYGATEKMSGQQSPEM